MLEISALQTITMSKQVGKRIAEAAKPFVARDVFPNYTVNLSNFQGHHKKALTKMSLIAPQVDLVLELRDARVPVSSVNSLFDRVLKGKPKLVMYTKTDLSNVNPDLFSFWHPDGDYRALDSRDSGSAKQILDYVKAFHESMVPAPPLGLRMLITGMPNAGKSTFLNTLRRVGMKEMHKVARTGSEPGVTRNISSTIRISKDPDIFIFDTPGVFVPRVKDSETMIKLCLAGAVNRAHVEPLAQADYLLYMYNKQYPDGSPYSRFYDRPTNFIEPILRGVAKDKGRPWKDNEIDQRGMAIRFIELWRRGILPPLVLDDLAKGVPTENQEFRDLNLEPSAKDVKQSNRYKRRVFAQ